jgi:DmsE family decaheme c-type cytochrome
MIGKRGLKYLMIITAALVMVVAGNLRGLPAVPAVQQTGSTMQDCAACHEEVVKAFGTNRHEALEKGAPMKVANPCESCHGPGKAHMEAGGDKTKVVGFKGKDYKKYTEQCLTCHKNSREVNGYMASMHGKQGLSCADCHSVHGGAPMTKMLKSRSSELCVSCHQQQKTEFGKPFHHPVLKEKAMECNDCHQPHSGIDRRQLTTGFAGQEICTKCHTETKGPYVFEHGAIRLRGCGGCHETHGSVNPKMLVRTTMTALCLECHSKSAAGSKVMGSQPPSFHNLNSPTYRNCTTCHVKIHGSNFDRLFLK